MNACRRWSPEFVFGQLEFVDVLAKFNVE